MASSTFLILFLTVVFFSSLDVMTPSNAFQIVSNSTSHSDSDTGPTILQASVSNVDPVGCTWDSDCLSKTPHSICYAGQCHCEAGYVPVTRRGYLYQQCEKGTVTISCNYDYECLSISPNSVCYLGDCHCKAGYVPVTKKDKLYQQCESAQVRLGEECSLDSQCVANDIDSVCSNGVCVCKTGFHRSGQSCVEDSGNRRGIGEECISTLQCVANDIASSCRNGVCVCDTGYRSSGQSCVKDTGTSELATKIAVPIGVALVVGIIVGIVFYYVRRSRQATTSTTTYVHRPA